jgi:hypothetical protein
MNTFGIFFMMPWYLSWSASTFSINALPIQGYRMGGSHSGGGEKPLSVHQVKKYSSPGSKFLFYSDSIPKKQ